MVNNLSAKAGDTSDGFDLWVTQVPRSRKWQPTLVGWKIPWTGMPGGQRSPWCCMDREVRGVAWTEKSVVLHGQRSPWCDKVLDATEHTGTLAFRRP